MFKDRCTEFHLPALGLVVMQYWLLVLVLTLAVKSFYLFEIAGEKDGG